MRKQTRQYQDQENSPRKQLQIKQQPQQQYRQFYQLSQNLKKSYLLMKTSQQSSSSSNIFSSQNNKVILYLKQLYMKEQSSIVKGIKEMAQQSKIIIEDLNGIENDIDKYQVQIDQWIKKIQALSSTVQKIRSTEGPFKKRAAGMAKLKEALNVTRRR